MWGKRDTGAHPHYRQDGGDNWGIPPESPPCHVSNNLKLLNTINSTISLYMFLCMCSRDCQCRLRLLRRFCKYTLNICYVRGNILLFCMNASISYTVKPRLSNDSKPVQVGLRRKIVSQKCHRFRPNPRISNTPSKGE